MITGPWINGSAVVIGGMAGAIISARLPIGCESRCP